MPHKRDHSLKILDEIAAERFRQISDEGFDPRHDDRYLFGELSRAAGCYAQAAGRHIASLSGFAMPWATYRDMPMPPEWPWAARWWKPKSAREDLIRAGALILAQVEAIDRSASGEAADGFNPHGSGPTPVQPRLGPAERRAILEGPPGILRAEIAERAARAGFHCSFLPARGTGPGLHVTLVGKPGAGKSALLNAIADAGFVVKERRSIKDRGEPAEAAVIYGKSFDPAGAGKAMAEVA